MLAPEGLGKALFFEPAAHASASGFSRHCDHELRVIPAVVLLSLARMCTKRNQLRDSAVSAETFHPICVMGEIQGKIVDPRAIGVIRSKVHGQ
jgi:hypothetical protein